VGQPASPQAGLHNITCFAWSGQIRARLKRAELAHFDPPNKFVSWNRVMGWFVGGLLQQLCFFSKVLNFCFRFFCYCLYGLVE